MKVKGILRIITDDNKVFLKRISVKYKDGILITKIDGKDLKFVFPSPHEVNCDKPIVYAITDSYPIINPDRITRIPNPTKKYLEVTVR